jgi:hypothetical protein
LRGARVRHPSRSRGGDPGASVSTARHE